MGLLAAPIWGHGQPLPAGTAQQVGVTHRSYVVQPGDTLAGIVRRFDPGADQARAVAALRSELGGAPLRPGAVLVLP